MPAAALPEVGGLRIHPDEKSQVVGSISSQKIFHPPAAAPHVVPARIDQHCLGLSFAPPVDAGLTPEQLDSQRRQTRVRWDLLNPLQIMRPYVECLLLLIRRPVVVAGRIDARDLNAFTDEEFPIEIKPVGAIRNIGGGGG